MDAAPPAWIAAGVGILSAIVTSLVSYTRSVTITEVQVGDLRTRVEELKSQRDNEHKEMKASFELMQRNIGEAIAGFRQSVEIVDKKIYQVELWGRDNHVHQNDFREFRRSIESKLDRIEDKIDKIDKIKDAP